MLQTSNSSAGHGSIWLVWEKSTASSLGMIYLMTHNRFGWSGQIPLLQDNNDNIAPSLAQLANGTIILVWSEGTGVFGTYVLCWMGYNGTRWTNPSNIVSASPDNVASALTTTSDGRVWLVWSRSTPANGGGDLYYKIYNGTWTPETPLVATLALEGSPSITQSSDGKVWVVYDSNSGGNNQLWDVTWTGSSWSTPAKLTNTSNDDGYPSIAMDRSGELWTFWSRYLPTGDPANPFQFDLFYKNSTNLGATWGPDTQLGFPQYTNSDQVHPTTVQSWDKTLWIVYASNQAFHNPYGSFNLYLLQSSPIKGHDVAVTNIKVAPPPAWTSGLVPPNPRQGEIVQVYITVTNLGDYSESGVALTAYINNNFLGFTNITSLSPGKVSTFLYTWNSTRSPLAHYTILATVSQVRGEVTTSNNLLFSDLFLVSRGDANRDGIVNVLDLATIGARFGSSPGNILYSVDADLNHDSTININDLVICAGNFGAVG